MILAFIIIKKKIMILAFITIKKIMILAFITIKKNYDLSVHYNKKKLWS